MNTIARVLRLARAYLPGFALAAVLVSAGTVASLFEPWIYRAIVDEIAGVFVVPKPLASTERIVMEAQGWTSHLAGSGKRIFHAPLRAHREKGTRRMIESRTRPQALATVVVGAVLLVLSKLLSEIARIRGDNRSTELASRVERNFIVDAFRHVMRLPLEFFSRRPSGAIARQIDQSDQVAPIITAFSLELWPDLVSLLAILAIVFSLNRELALVILIAVPVYGLVTWRMLRKLETRLDAYYGLWDEVSGRIQQAVGGIKTVLAHGAGDHETERVESTTRVAFDAYLDRNRTENRYVFLQSLVIDVSKAGVLVLGGVKALEHQLTPGDVVLFITYLGKVYDPIENLTGLYTALQEHITSLRRAEKLLDAPEAPGADRPALPAGPGEIEYRDVSFAYRKDRPVLSHVSFRIRPGERVALVGPSGAGKTTLTDLLMGLYRPRSGEILVDGHPLSEVAPASLRARIRAVATDGTLFHTSIAENIRYGRFEAGDADVAEAARLAGLGPLLERLPEGLATEVGERGVELSAGERQRVLLGRAFVARPEVLILDEATANLDFRTEAAIQDSLRELARGRTTIVIAHRRSMVVDVDRVLVLRGGVIEQDGTPAELLARPGYFRDMMTTTADSGAG